MRMVAPDPMLNTGFMAGMRSRWLVDLSDLMAPDGGGGVGQVVTNALQGTISGLTVLNVRVNR
jgi:hypothetical protein